MEFTCLSEGKGFYYPPCHILDISGFRILLDCPMDLSSLLVFSPVPIDPNPIISNEKTSLKIDKPLDASSLICAQPRYRTVKNLILWDVSFIDVVLISSPMGMMGLPFLTRNKDFSAKVYATEVAARIGQLMMEDLVAMHKEYRQFYGPEYDSPEWMKWDELDSLPIELKQILFGADGAGFAGWMPLYSAADVKDCMLKVESLKYAEETCYNGTLMMSAFSSGLEIGSCNWKITCPKGSVAYISSSVFSPLTAMSFDYKSLQRSDVILYSDFSSCNAADNFEADNNVSNSRCFYMSFDWFIMSSLLSFLFTFLFISHYSDDDVNLEASIKLGSVDEYTEEMEKLNFICSSSIDFIKAGGSVLIPIGRHGIVLQLLEQLAVALENENMKVPIFVVSSVAEELTAYANIIPEWLCEQLQDRAVRGGQTFKAGQTSMAKIGKNRQQIELMMYLFPAIHSLKLLTNWQEPCIVFCPHWSFRLGPVTHLLRRWCGDPNSLLVIEKEVDAGLALLPFKPMEIDMKMKVLQCPFLSGITLQKSHQLLKLLQPKHVVFPEILRQHNKNNGHSETSFSFSYYKENEKVHIPYTKKDSELDIAEELVNQLQSATLTKQEMTIARLRGELVLEQGRQRLILGNDE
ncbi:hypothetical protein MIMGU_mgv1a002829mg [Erythranthe guttata]|uniref:Beta-Casp domain-containing protein n=1 Tax=Erythranthe guttata TaxID=4155 RepID=A0A022S0I3_ERYGU|nr:hypothetical protein MIMGU_mgv1a002829mg [Erythranthe guttata]